MCIGVFVRICKYANAGSRVFEFMIDLHIYECVFVCVGGGVCGSRKPRAGRAHRVLRDNK